jgi:hypothetical protein
VVDRFLIVEHDFTHSGRPAPFLYKLLGEELRSITGNEKIEVHSISISNDVIRNASTSQEMHFNENLIRKSFLEHCKIEQDDFIFSIDADEVLFRKTYLIIGLLRWITPKKLQKFSLKLHQFFYKMNYLWVDNTFRSPVAVSARFAFRDPAVLRDSGRLFPFWAGCHFSWQLSIPQMLEKLTTYAHSPEFHHLANPGILESAIGNKEYPFEPERPFTIKVLNSEEIINYLPKSFVKVNSFFPKESFGTE